MLKTYQRTGTVDAFRVEKIEDVKGDADHIPLRALIDEDGNHWHVSYWFCKKNAIFVGDYCVVNTVDHKIEEVIEGRLFERTHRKTNYVAEEAFSG